MVVHEPTVHDLFGAQLEKYSFEVRSFTKRAELDPQTELDIFFERAYLYSTREAREHS